ncbi:PH domain-containing protein [Actinoplanes hulinensis]|uniref:PH domain-containing protein n=1 Tax=Actinoplanes hulinensis TaxID=1144547 RepID=A0ABS7B8R7_9ACTN|nr:PH domain-containing protein [Actinoplanes hulinensis]MBW6437031.1 PH domain-containing protein [Actinoplanes hulinensis]
MSRPRVLRSLAGLLFFSVAGGVLICLPLLAATAFLTAADPGPAPVGLIAMMAGFALLGAFLLRLAMVRVVLHDDHIALVNPLRTFRFYWFDVEDVDIVSSGGWIVRVWAGGVPRWAWGVSRIGRFGLPFASVHDGPAQDAPCFVHDGYQAIRTAWQRGQRRR